MSPAFDRVTRAIWLARRAAGAAPTAVRMLGAGGVERLRARTPATGADRHQGLRGEAEALHGLAVRMGGLMIKVGQAIAARADLFPPEYVSVLSTLEDRVPPRPFAVIRRQLETELARPLEGVFERLDEQPLAAASLAQVHRGRLRDGREVAVKVLYPGIEDEVRRDLDLLGWMLPLVVPAGRGVALEGVIDEITHAVPAELDLVNEGHNAERVASDVARRGDVVVPRIVWECTTRRVLVMQYIDGIKITDVPALRAAGIDVQAVCQILVDVYCEQVFATGFFQADPHPGNLLVLPGPRLVILDFGLAKALSEPVRRALGDLVRGVFCEDEPGTVAAFRALGFQTADDAREPMLALGQLFLGTMTSERGYAELPLVLQADRRFREAAAAHPVTIPGDLALVARVMGTLSGIGKRLDSRVNIPLSMLLHT